MSKFCINIFLMMLISTGICAQSPNATNGYLDYLNSYYSGNLTITESLSKDSSPLESLDQIYIRKSFEQLGSVTISDNLHQLILEVDDQSLKIINSIPDGSGGWIVDTETLLNTLQLLSNENKNIETHNWFVGIKIDGNGNPSISEFIISGDSASLSQALINKYITTKTIQ